MKKLSEKTNSFIKNFRRRKKYNPNFHFRKAEKGEIIIEMKEITKRFPGVLANDHINLTLKAGEIHAILGENGAGKTTLMNILNGFYQPDEGEIYIRGKKVTLRSPKDAIDLGIGMVHQHFMLIPRFTVIENITLGLKSSRGLLLDSDRAERKVAELAKKYGLKITPRAKVGHLSVGEQQRVEIIKALYRNAHVLILDEPTAMLTPGEVGDLMKILRRMAMEGLAIIPFITHKLPEVMAISDKVTILKKGRVVSTVETKHTNEKELARKMVGREVLFTVTPSKVKKGRVVLEVNNLQALNDEGVDALKNVSFSVSEGEILGIAGVAGNGQRELIEVIYGLRKASAGKIIILGRDTTNNSPREIIKQGVGYIPEDRTSRGLVMVSKITENLIMKNYSKSPLAYRWFLPFNKQWFLNSLEIDRYAEKLISEYGIVTTSKDSLAANLSGGNLQRLILARELSQNIKLLIASQPTRGLDIGATEYVHRKLIEQKEKGTAILLISGEIDEIISMSDRIAVMYEGEIVGIVSREEAESEKIGLMMAGVK